MGMSITADSGVKFNDFAAAEIQANHQAWDQASETGDFEIDTNHHLNAPGNDSNSQGNTLTAQENTAQPGQGFKFDTPTLSYTSFQDNVLANAQAQDQADSTSAADTEASASDSKNSATDAGAGTKPSSNPPSNLDLENQADVELVYYHSKGYSSAQIEILEINPSAETNQDAINPLKNSSTNNGVLGHAQSTSNAYSTSKPSTDSASEFKFLGFDADTLADARTASFNETADNVFGDLVAGAQEVDEEFSLGTRTMGGLQMFSGGAEALAGFYATGTVAGSIVGIPAMVHGGDNFWAGVRTAVTGESVKPFTVQALEKAGMSSTAAELTNAGLSIGLTAGPTIASRMAGNSHVVTESYYPLTRAGVGDFVAENTRLQTRSTPEAIKLMFDDSLNVTQQQHATNSMNEFVQNPVGKAFYERLLNSDTKIKFTNGSALQDPAVYRPRENAIRINLTRPQDIGSSISHELTHAARVERFNVKPSQYEEYRAFRSQSLYEQGGTRPTLEQRKEIWGQVQQRYSDLPIGKNPFGGN
jgi:hypothetical protein